RMVARIDRVEAVVCDSEHEAAWLERNLLEHALPRWNRTPGAEESGYIRLRDGSRAPGLEFARAPEPGARTFGPYLGTSSVRLAISALRRVLPLTYAGERPTGFARAMARALGVGPDARDGLVHAAARILERDRRALAAFRSELARRRDAAAQSLAFELAAQVQAELAAVD